MQNFFWLMTNGHWLIYKNYFCNTSSIVYLWKFAPQILALYYTCTCIYTVLQWVIHIDVNCQHTCTHVTCIYTIHILKGKIKCCHVYSFMYMYIQHIMLHVYRKYMYTHNILGSPNYPPCLCKYTKHVESKLCSMFMTYTCIIYWDLNM